MIINYKSCNYIKWRNCLIICFCLILLKTTPFFSQTNSKTPKVKQFNLEDGLSQVSINDLIKDNNGLVWIATADGLNRFDGKLFKHYKIDESNPSSLQGSFINKLLYDHKGRIWIGTLSHGLSMLESNYSKFRKVYQKKDSSDVMNITTLETDGDKNLWIGSEKEGLYRLDLNNLNQHQFIFQKPISALKYDTKNNVLWIGDIDGNIYMHNTTSNNKPELVASAKEHVRSFYITESSIIVGSNEGVFHFNPTTKEIKHREIETSGSFQTKYVLTFLEKDKNSVWIGSGNGLYLYNWVDDIVEDKYENSEKSKVQLTNNTLHCALQISENKLLIGTASGLNLLDFDTPYFKNISKNKKGQHLLNDNVIFSIHKNAIGLWVGTSRGGLNLITDTGTYYYSHHQNTSNFIAAPTVRALQEDEANKRLWIATSRGLSMFDLKDFNPKKPIIRNFYHEPSDVNSINTDFLKDIALDNNNNLWGASYGQGIFRLEIDQQHALKITRYKHNNTINSLVDDVTQKLKFDSKGNLWIGTRNGLSKLSFSDNNYSNYTFQNYTHNEKDINSLSENSVYDIYEDINKNVWIGTRKGLSLFNGSNFKNWTAQKQFPNDIIYIIQGDSKGNLWLGTNDGIVQFKPKNQEFNHYGITDNIQGKEFDIHAGYMDKTENIYFGGIDGITYFHPDNLSEVDKPQKLYFSELRLKNEDQEPLITQNSILTQGLINTHELKFKHNQLPFYLEVSSIDYRLHKNVEFAYRLLPENEDWITLKDREIQFLNLPSGTHNLEVNGFSRGKKWDQPSLEMSIKVLPPWWSTNLAYGMYILALSLLAYTFYRFQLSKKLAIAESNKLKELNQLKSNLYTNITHEFRTPLTVILGLSDTIKNDIETHEDVKAKESLQIIERNGKDLLQLVNQLLGLSKIESGTVNLDLVQADVIPFLRYICESFQSLAHASTIGITIYSEIEELIMDFDDNKLQVVVANLLSNAIKFSPRTESIIFHINNEFIEEQEFLVIKVKDNGLGIPEKAISHIFDRFYQAENSLTKAGKGTGIGLALTKDLIELMDGTIGVKSKEKKGTEFTVKIPVTRKSKQVAKTFKPVKTNPIKVNTNEWKLKLFDQDSNLPQALIIEDNEDVIYYLKICLQDKFQCLIAENGNLGIEMAYNKIPDIIICDVMMPGIEGYEVCKTLKSDHRTDHIPIIMLTAKTSEKDRLKGLAHGADAYITKPFLKAELLTRLDQLVLLRKRMMQSFSKNKFSQILTSKEENPETKFLQKIIQIIHDQIDESSFGSRHIAQKLRLSESQIYRKLKAITGKSTAVFIRSVRLEKAKDLIQTTEKSISEIAYEVGFNDPSWFSRAFKEEFGHNPSAIHK